MVFYKSKFYQDVFLFFSTARIESALNFWKILNAEFIILVFLNGLVGLKIQKLSNFIFFYPKF